mmetsp:Transcript_44475/g.123049  ORF Transcript_44475/g.123049 Transcript_44475/m.123049 type:complete len:354 (-) Transcript_44475:28-1089(-)
MRSEEDYSDHGSFCYDGYSEYDVRDYPSDWLVSVPAGCGPSSLVRPQPAVVLDRTMHELRGVRSDHGLVSSHCLPMPHLPPMYANDWGSGDLNCSRANFDCGPCMPDPRWEFSRPGLEPAVDAQRQFSHLHGQVVGPPHGGPQHLHGGHQAFPPQCQHRQPMPQRGSLGFAISPEGLQLPKGSSAELGRNFGAHAPSTGSAPFHNAGLMCSVGSLSVDGRAALPAPLLHPTINMPPFRPCVGGPSSEQGRSALAVGVGPFAADHSKYPMGRAAIGPPPPRGFTNQFKDSSAYLASPAATERLRDSYVDADANSDGNASPPATHRFSPRPSRRTRSKDVETSCIRSVMPCLVTC